MHFLNSQCNCPFSLMSVEKTHRFNGMNRRSDLVLFNSESKALLLAECKAPDVPLKQNAFDQVARYNLILGVPFILVTNGITTYCGRVDRAQESFIYLNDIPSYQHMCGFV